MKKKIDSRIRTLIENGINANHRTFFVVVGDKGRDQVYYFLLSLISLISNFRINVGKITKKLQKKIKVVNLHYMLTKAAVRARPSILWCYKKELGFSR